MGNTKTERNKEMARLFTEERLSMAEIGRRYHMTRVNVSRVIRPLVDKLTRHRLAREEREMRPFNNMSEEGREAIRKARIAADPEHDEVLDEKHASNFSVFAAYYLLEMVIACPNWWENYHYGPEGEFACKSV